MDKKSVQEYIDKFNEQYKDSDKSYSDISKTINETLPDDMNVKDVNSLLGQVLGRQIRKTNELPQTKDSGEILKQIMDLNKIYDTKLSGAKNFSDKQPGAFYKRGDKSINVHDKLQQDQVLGLLPEELQHSLSTPITQKRDYSQIPEGMTGKEASDLLDQQHLGSDRSIYKKMLKEELPKELENQSLKKQLLAGFAKLGGGLKMLPGLGMLSGAASGIKDYQDAAQNPNMSQKEKILRIMNILNPDQTLNEEIDKQKKLREYTEA